MHESPTSSVEERTDEAHRYLTALWPAGFRTDAVLSLVTLPGGASYRFTLDHTHDAAAQAVALADQGLDVYAGMGLIDPDAGGRGKAGDVWHIPGAWADIDILGPTHKATDLPPTREAALAALAELPPPTMLVDSGGGFQAHWVGEGVWAPAAGDVVEGIQAALRSVFSARGWSLDGTADVSRIFRVAGTLNYKEPGNPRPVRLVQLDGPRYNPGPLRDRFVVAEAVRETCAVPDEPPYSGDGYGLEDALTNLAEACDAIETAGPGESNDVLKAKAYYI